MYLLQVQLLLVYHHSFDPSWIICLIAAAKHTKMMTSHMLLTSLVLTSLLMSGVSPQTQTPSGMCCGIGANRIRCLTAACQAIRFILSLRVHDWCGLLVCFGARHMCTWTRVNTRVDELHLERIETVYHVHIIFYWWVKRVNNWMQTSEDDSNVIWDHLRLHVMWLSWWHWLSKI